MTSLVGLASVLGPARETVKFGETEVELRGLSALELGQVFRRFPDFRQEMLRDHEDGVVDGERSVTSVACVTGSGSSQSVRERAMDMMAHSEGAIPAIIAAGIGKMGDEEEEAAARSLRMEVQMALVTAVMRLSYPDAPTTGPFVGAPKPPSAANGADQPGTAQALS